MHSRINKSQENIVLGRRPIKQNKMIHNNLCKLKIHEHVHIQNNTI